MVERRTQEGMAAPIPETKINVLETTLAKLGIDTSFDNLNLAGDKFTLRVKKVGEDTVFVGRLNHPLGGGHFAQFLNSVSPFGDQDAAGIIGDINLPILAEDDYQKGKDRTSSGYIRLHESHLNDPRVGPPYRRFAESHVDRWLKALESRSSRDVFWVLEKVKFIANLKTFTDSYFSEVEEEIALWNKKRYPELSNITRTDKILNVGWWLLDKGSQHGCDGFKQLLYDTRGLGEIESRKQLYEEYCKLTVEQGIDLIKTFFERNPNSKQEFVLNYFFLPKEVLVDLENGCLRGQPYIQARLLDEETLEIGDREGTRFLVVPNKNVVIPGGYGLKIKDCEFSDAYLSSKANPPLYPVIAWKTDVNGNRSFLTQKEAMPYIKELGLEEGEQGDVKLGEIAVAYFARGIIKKWPAKMKLASLERVKSFRGPDFEQPMRGGQMPAWVAVEQHKAQLLKSETSVLARSEQYLASVP